MIVCVNYVLYYAIVCSVHTQLDHWAVTSPAASCTLLCFALLGMDGGEGRKQELTHHAQMVKFLAPSSLAGMI